MQVYTFHAKANFPVDIVVSGVGVYFCSSSSTMQIYDAEDFLYIQKWIHENDRVIRLIAKIDAYCNSAPEGDMDFAYTQLYRMLTDGDLKAVLNCDFDFTEGGMEVIKGHAFELLDGSEYNRRRLARQDFKANLKKIISVAKPEPGIYYLKRGGKVIYVGKSTSVKNRLKQHISDGRTFDDISVVYCPESELGYREAEAVATLKPCENKAEVRV
jgi:hypothetical protein